MNGKNNCALCHGAAGEGIGPIPPLDNPGLREADYDFLYKTIARGRYDTSMAGWHEDEGGVFNDYQVDELVALVRYVDWPQVGELSAAKGLIPPTLPVPEADEGFLAEVAALSPEGSIWAEGMSIYAGNCTICHGINGEGSDLAVLVNTPEIRATDTAELARIINEGVPSTMMAGWGSVLETADVNAVISFLQNWDAIEGEGLVLTPPKPLRIDLDNPQEILALGERLYTATCIACHGENGSGGPPWRQAGTAPNNDQQALPQTQGPAIFLSGEVVTADGNVLTFLAADGSLTEAMLGPPWFWSERGILLRSGDKIELEGFESPDHMELNWITNITTGESIQLRNTEGMPVWNE